MSNHFNLLTLFGLLMLGVSLAFLGVAGQFYLEQSREYHHESTSEFWAKIGFTISGIWMTFFSVALLLKYKWARSGLLLAHVTGFITWTILFLTVLRDDPRAWMVLSGFSGFVYCFLLFGIFFLNNKYVLQHYEELYYRNEDHPDILDV